MATLAGWPYCVRSNTASKLPPLTLVPHGFEKPTTFKRHWPLPVTLTKSEAGGDKWREDSRWAWEVAGLSSLIPFLESLLCAGPFALVHAVFSLWWVFLTRAASCPRHPEFPLPVASGGLTWLHAVSLVLKGPSGFAGTRFPRSARNLQQVALSPQFCRLQSTFAFFFRNLFTYLFGIMVF